MTYNEYFIIISVCLQPLSLVMCYWLLVKGCAPGGTRTPNRLLRRQLLYPIELRVHCFKFSVRIVYNGNQQKTRFVKDKSNFSYCHSGPRAGISSTRNEILKQVQDDRISCIGGGG